jgi:hypothetical protein
MRDLQRQICEAYVWMSVGLQLWEKGIVVGGAKVNPENYIFKLIICQFFTTSFWAWEGLVAVSVW